MPYLPLPNFNYDSGPRRIQSGPNHEGYLVLSYGVQSTGPDDGIIVGGAPLSGTAASGAWSYDSNWRYVPSTLPSQSGSIDPTPYNASGTLGAYKATRIYTRDNVAGAQAASAVGPETGKANPRGAALQPRADVTRPETYMYYGGAAPDNQDYSPYNTPDANSAAEGKTGGGVTHRSYESTLLTNVLGSQGTSDRSQWRYHQPVYCKTYTETRRSESPGLMSTPLRYVYRGSASSYNYNYGGELLANKGGFQLLPYEQFQSSIPPSVPGCGIPLPPLSTTGAFSPSLVISIGDTLTVSPLCPYKSAVWFSTGSSDPVGTGPSYTVKSSDISSRLYVIVTYLDDSTDSSGLTGLATPAIGSPFQGGYFGGFFSHTADSVPTHALIVAPRAGGSAGTGYGPIPNPFPENRSYKLPSPSPDPFVHSLFDGFVNRLGVINDNVDLYPTMKFCVNMGIGGYTDWYPPSLYEMLALFIYFKPTTQTNTTGWGANPYSVPRRNSNFTPSFPAQTTVEIFKAGNAEAWGTTAGPRTSNEDPFNTASAYGFDWATGGVFSNSKLFIGPVRAMRKIAL